MVYHVIVSRLGGCRPHSFVIRRTTNNAPRRPTRCSGDDTDDGYNDDDGGAGDDDDDDDYYNCSLLLQNKPKMRSCRRWSQADSLALDTPPLTAKAFMIGGAVSTPDGGRPRYGGPSSLQQTYTPPPLQQQLPSLQLSSLHHQQLSSSPPPLPPPPLMHKPLPLPPPPPPSSSERTADLPAIPESSQWDEQQRARHRRRTPERQRADRLERNGSARVSGRNPYRTFNGRAASPAGATALGSGGGGGGSGVVPAGHCQRDSLLQVRFCFPRIMSSRLLKNLLRPTHTYIAIYTSLLSYIILYSCTEQHALPLSCFRFSEGPVPVLNCMDVRVVPF